MKYCKQIFALSVVAILALVSFFPVGSAWGQPSPLFPGDQTPPTFAVSPFFIDTTNDGSVIVANTGESGDLCANIYLFTPAGQMTACCACPVKQNGLLELSITDLNKNPVTGVPLTKGVIKVVPGGYCYPAYVNVAAGMKTYQIIRSNTQAVTSPPIPVPDTPLAGGELLTLMRQCQNIMRNGGGLGICSCPAQ
jgi:hypothetical protein